MRRPKDFDRVEHINQRLTKHNLELTGVINRIHEKAELRCLVCGSRFTAFINNAIAGKSGCKQCRINQRASDNLDQFKFELLFVKGITGDEDNGFVCRSRHGFKSTYERLMAKPYCPICADISVKKRLGGNNLYNV